MYGLIDCNRERYTVEMMARVLRISPRSYYHHKRGTHNLREQKRKSWSGWIQQVYAAAKGRYGVPPYRCRDSVEALLYVREYDQ